MHGDALFRVVLLLGVISIVPVGAFYRVKAHAAGDRFNRREEGLIIFLALRPLGMAGMAGLLLFVIHPPWMAWSSMPLPDGVRWIGVAIGVIAGALFIWTLKTLGPNLTDTIGTRARHTLVTHGPYRWVRHPLYVASALAVTANALAAANWFIGGTGAAAVLLMMIRSTREEQRLEERFGPEYTRYARRTGRFLPRFRSSTTPEQ